MKPLVALLAALSVGLGAAAFVLARTSSNNGASTTTQIERGRVVYNFRCYFCHGYSGDARTVAAEYLTPRPRDFTQADARTFDVPTIARAVEHGKPGTAMKGFTGILEREDMLAVASFVYEEFVLRRAVNTRYHTIENGWPNHERYAAAFPFAQGAIPLDRPAEQMTEHELRGLMLFMGACVTCHDQGRKTEDRARWEIRPVSYPPNASSCMSCHNRDGASLGSSHPANRSATYVDRAKPRDVADPHALHDRAPQLSNPTPQQREGERLYQANCAFCHAADGTGRNWIGGFIEPHPANFKDGAFMAKLTRGRMRRAIDDGVVGTSMPSWKSVLEPKEIDAIMSYIALAFHPLAIDSAEQATISASP